MTLSQMASAIRNNILDGLDGASTLVFSIEQLQDEILQTTATTIVTLAAQGLLDITTLTQRVDGIRIECKDISSNCAVKSELVAPSFSIPNVNRMTANPISYLGSVDGELDIKVYFDRDYRYHKYRLATAKAPFAWVSTTADPNGMYQVFLFNMSKYDHIKFVTIEAVFDNPYDLQKTDYYAQFLSSEYYAPLYIQKQVMDSITQQWVNYYRQLHLQPKPNTQQG